MSGEKKLLLRFALQQLHQLRCSKFVSSWQKTKTLHLCEEVGLPVAENSVENEVVKCTGMLVLGLGLTCP